MNTCMIVISRGVLNYGMYETKAKYAVIKHVSTNDMRQYCNCLWVSRRLLLAKVCGGGPVLVH